MFGKHTHNYELFFTFQLNDYYKYIDIMEDSINSYKQNLLKWFEEESKGVDEKIKQAIFEFKYLDDYQDLEQIYTFILRKSLFITLHSFMETELQRAATALEDKEVNVKLSDLKYSGARKYLFYIESVHNIKIDLSTDIRETFIKYTDLRNYFVHNESTDIDLKLHKKIRSLPHITFSKYPHNKTYKIEMLEKEFNKAYLDLISDLFKKLFRSLERKVMNN